MSAWTTLPGAPPRRASLAAAFAAGVILLVAPLSAAVVNPWQDAPPTATSVAPADASGVNVLEPADATSTAAVKAAGTRTVERTVSEWNPTGRGGGGGGGKGSPKG